MRWPFIGMMLLVACRQPDSFGVGPDGGTCFGAAPDSVVFGEVEIGTTANTFVRVRNLTTWPLRVSATPVEAPFNLDPIPDAIEPGGSLFIGVRFTPGDGLLHFGSFKLEAEGGCAVEVPLRGLGSGAVVISPQALDFGAIDPGESRRLELSFSNSRRNDVTFDTRISSQSSAAPPFELEAASPLTIPAGQIVSVGVRARPLTYEHAEALLLLSGPDGSDRCGSRWLAALLPPVFVPRASTCRRWTSLPTRSGRSSSLAGSGCEMTRPRQARPSLRCASCRPSSRRVARMVG